MRRPGLLIRALMVLGVLAVGGGALALALLGTSASANDPFHGSPVPALFPDARIRTVDASLKAAEARGHRVAKAWLDRHPLATDAAFSSWALNAVGPPPGGKAPAGDLAELKALAANRDATGTTAATWLESHGKKQPWKFFRKQAKPFLPAAQYAGSKTALDAAFTLASTLQGTAKVRYARPSPYVTDPSLNGLNQARYAGQTRLSYPSKHTMDTGVALAVLGPLAPHLRGEFDWMADEIAFSRMYAAGHYRSDLVAGAFLGTLIGDYEARKHHLLN